MRASDFEYDGINLSDFGFVICHFGSKGLETTQNGGQVTFNTVSTLSGKKHKLVSTKYEDCAANVIQICKTPCSGDVMEISSIELREIARWLGRNKFLKFKLLDENYIDLYFEARFKISKIELDGIIYGLELEIETNAPFAFKEPKTIIIEYDDKKGESSSLYTWEKYNAIKVNPYSIVYEKGIDIADNYTITRTLYKSVSINDNGELILSGVLDDGTSYGSEIEANYKNYPYINVDGLIYKITSYELIGQYQGYSGTTELVKVQVHNGGYIKGNYIEEVTSTSSNAYPNNGYKDGYWYISKGLKTDKSMSCSIYDTSHEEGYIYPYTEITILEDSDLNIYNAIENRNTFIANCKKDEVIIMDYPVIQSSNLSHNIQNDFNWNFFRIANTFNNNKNDLIISPCKIKIEYSPIIKVGL